MFKESAKLLVWLIPVLLLALIVLPQAIRILREYERGVIFRLGKLLGTAATISAQPIALQLRFLQTMKEISSEHSTTTILPVPLDLFAPFSKRSESRRPNES